MTVRHFRDRREAGGLLAALLRDYAGRSDVVVLALPRGGVPVGYEVAAALQAPLDVFAVRKLGVPGHEEFAMGALASVDEAVVDGALIDAFSLSREAVQRVIERERTELIRRQRQYRDRRPSPRVEGKVVILVGDGLTSGASMFAAVDALRHMRPARIIVAVPIAPADTCQTLRRHADEVVLYTAPDPGEAVSAWYEDFEQVGDDEVRRLLTSGQPAPVS
jgi:predicted phosphoribosyltransferase